MKQLIAVFAIIAIIAPMPAKSESPMALVYGRIARLESGETFVFPETINGFGFRVPTSANQEISGLKVVVDSKVTNGQDFVGIGLLDSYAGCFEPDWYKIGEIDWESGLLGNGFIESVGQKITVVTTKSRSIKHGFYVNPKSLADTEVDAFGAYNDGKFEILAMTDMPVSNARFCGKITGIQETGIVDFEAVRVYGPRSSETMQVLAQTNPTTLLQNGAGLATLKTLGTGKLGVCEGLYNPQSKIMQAKTVVYDLNSSVFGGRTFGIVTSVGMDNMVIQTMLPGCVTASVKCKTDTAQVNNGINIVKGSPRDWAIPGKTVVEVFGAFENDQFTVNAKLVRIDPVAASRYFCGFYMDGYIHDIFGGRTKYVATPNTKVLLGAGEPKDGMFVTGWAEKGRAVGILYPEIGLLGFRVAGTLKEIRRSSYVINVTDAFDMRLPGREFEVFFTEKSRVVDPKKGFIAPESVEPFTKVGCWGQIDEDFRFVVTLADTD